MLSKSNCIKCQLQHLCSRLILVSHKEVLLINYSDLDSEFYTFSNGENKHYDLLFLIMEIGCLNGHVFILRGHIYM